MKIHKTIRDAEIGSDVADPLEYVERSASRAVVFDREGKVALFHSTVKNYHKLPGGGVEEGENLEEALRRELSEEIGCMVENIRELVAIEEYRNKFNLHQISHCFIADLFGDKGIPKLEEDEIAEGFVAEWVQLDDAIKILAEEIVDDYQGKFIQIRDLTFLKEAKNRLGK